MLNQGENWTGAGTGEAGELSKCGNWTKVSTEYVQKLGKWENWAGAGTGQVWELGKCGN